LFLVALLVGGYFVFIKNNNKIKTSPLIVTSYFYKELLRIDSPSPNPKVKIGSPIEISGLAKGNWYFEASFPVQVLDEDGTVLGSDIGQAQSDWMTTDFVPFSGEISFSKPKAKPAVLFSKRITLQDFRQTMILFQSQSNLNR
jgi:hypothetical protein